MDPSALKYAFLVAVLALLLHEVDSLTKLVAALADLVQAVTELAQALGARRGAP